MVLPYIKMNLPQVYMCSPSWTLLPPRTIPLGRPSAPAPSIQYRASNLDWRLVSYMILYIFQCHSPKSSHPLPLPQSPKDCSIHQCLFCCLIYRVTSPFSPVWNVACIHHQSGEGMQIGVPSRPIREGGISGPMQNRAFTYSSERRGLRVLIDSCTLQDNRRKCMSFP